MGAHGTIGPAYGFKSFAGRDLVGEHGVLHVGGHQQLL
jgi:hypothetical protein